MILLWGMDRFNRVLACRDTFLVEIVREALGLARFHPSLMKAFREDMDLAAKTARKGRLMDRSYRIRAIRIVPSSDRRKSANTDTRARSQRHLWQHATRSEPKRQAECATKSPSLDP